jgi:hypothetical protein
LSAAGHLLGQASHRVTDGQSVTSDWEIEDAVLVTDCLWTDRIYLETGYNLQTAGLAASPSKVPARPLENYGVKVKAANLQDLPRDWLQLASSRASAGRVGASSAGGGTASCVGRSPLGWPPRPGLGSLVRLPLCGIRAGGLSLGEAAWRADASEVSAWWGLGACSVGRLTFLQTSSGGSVSTWRVHGRSVGEGLAWCIGQLLVEPFLESWR